jgi:hypothetical protein
MDGETSSDAESRHQSPKWTCEVSAKKLHRQTAFHPSYRPASRARNPMKPERVGRRLTD